jgi:hypothetical protein
MVSVLVVSVLVVLALLALAGVGRRGDSFVSLNTNVEQITRFLERYAKTSGGTTSEGEGWLQWTRSLGEDNMFLVFRARKDTHLVRQAVRRVTAEYKDAKIERIDFLSDDRDIPHVARRNFIYVRFTTPFEQYGEVVFLLRHNPSGSAMRVRGSRLVDDTKTLVPVGLNLSASKSPWIR